MGTLRPAQRRRLDAQLHLAEVARQLLPQAAVPYLAHLRVDTAGGERDLLLGLGTRTAGPVSVIDWQQAPLASVFFDCAEGDEYELPIEGGVTVSGRVLERNLVWFDRGQLVELATPSEILARGEDGEWSAGPSPGRILYGGDGERRAVSPVDVELDAAQRRVVDLPPERSVLVLGEAGCGKTTVALHRLASLRRRGKKRMRSAVIVPTDGLRRLIEILVKRMELEGVEVWRFDDWARHQARKSFRDLPRKESRATPAAALALKRDPSLRAAIAEIASRRAARADEDAPVRRGPLRAWANRDDLLHLYGDRDLMTRAARESIQQVRLSAVDELIEHTKLQFSEPSELALAHVDAERRRAVDDRELDEGTPEEDARSVDAEDYAVLFELDRLRALRRGKKPTLPRPYDLIVLDEAQELAPLELALVGRSVARQGTLIVAGDAEQQVDPSACFQGWASSMEDLGARDFETCTLEVSYRCPPGVTDLAREVRSGARARPPPPERAREVAQVRFHHDCHLAAWAVDDLRALLAADPRASVALVCRSAEMARRLAALIGRGVEVRLALGGDFDFAPGAHATAVGEVKGLEFDHVVVPDASAPAYPESPASRRALYVAITRPTRQLVLAAVGAWSPILSAPDGAATPRAAAPR
ncbi:MAG TPA: ATP-binding domain-containing protein [Myxococcales bacterium]|nr:ATP-binding domain-containing protein [Myxococcales bacterium]